mmetsp:Transcript_15092/g.35812  ORF Transcript_15092/g.35812 Transcript_15092/m.35812 type:complete len:250 (-) Transcript_15092:1211-1960(-)
MRPHAPPRPQPPRRPRFRHLGRGGESGETASSHHAESRWEMDVWHNWTCVCHVERCHRRDTSSQRRTQQSRRALAQWLACICVCSLGVAERQTGKTGRPLPQDHLATHPPPHGGCVRQVGVDCGVGEAASTGRGCEQAGARSPRGNGRRKSQRDTARRRTHATRRLVRGKAAAHRQPRHFPRRERRRRRRSRGRQQGRGRRPQVCADRGATGGQRRRRTPRRSRDRGSGGERGARSCRGPSDSRCRCRG